MYGYEWDTTTHGYKLTTHTGKFVANEIRPVYTEELTLIGFSERFDYDQNEVLPLMWAQKNAYFVNGEKVAQLNRTQYGKPLSAEYFFEGRMRLKPVNIPKMIKKNTGIMDLIVADAKRRIKEMYDEKVSRCDMAYIGFSGGKDSVVLLDLCHRVLPLTVPVVFSDTDMELPDTYEVWEEIQKRYPERNFIIARAESPALENWRRFGPPSRTIRWCCSIHKSAPALVFLKKKLKKSSIRAMAFLGVRGEESLSRSSYEDIGEGVKNSSQINLMPILDWGSHELYLYIFANDLILNRAYRFGIPRVGCIMCPQSSEKYEWLVNAVYPNILKPYCDVIIETSSKDFKSELDKTDFIGSLSWQARRSGIALSNTISKPIEEENQLQITWISTYLSTNLFNEWIKTLGSVEVDPNEGQKYLKIKGELGAGIPFKIITPQTGETMITFDFHDKKSKLMLLPSIRMIMQKSSACVGCRSCEAECPTGALHSKNGSIYIDNDKCTHCLNCHSVDYGCWRFKSMFRTEKIQNNLSGINRYNNFGLRENWLPILIERGKDFFPWRAENHPLGKKMVESASAWFLQASLINEKDKSPKPLVDLFKSKGTSFALGWDFIWMSLSNNAILIKWFVTSTQIDEIYSIEALLELLGDLNQSTKNGGIAALKDMLTKSPYASGERTIVSLESKGKVVTHIARHKRNVDPLVTLFGLYQVAHITGRTSFTIRELMLANSDSTYISPIVAFGMAAETFKQHCQGLQTRYPNYISCTFTHGLDEVNVYPQNFTADDVVGLVLGE